MTLVHLLTPEQSESRHIHFADLRSRFFAVKERLNFREKPVSFCLSASTFPNCQNPPTGFQQILLMLFVSGDVPADFFFPVRLVFIRPGSSGTVLMPMPKATVDKNCCIELLQNNIWLSWQPRQVQSVAVSRAKKKLADKKLRLCVFRSNPRHDFGPFVLCIDVHVFDRVQSYVQN